MKSGSDSKTEGRAQSGTLQPGAASSADPVMSAGRGVLDPVLAHLLLFGVVLVAAAAVIGGFDVGIGAGVGVIVAALNWMALRWVALRLLGGGRGKGAAIALLMTKMGLLALLCWVLLTRAGVHTIGFTVGIFALVLGLFTGTMRALSADTAETGGAATVHEES